MKKWVLDKTVFHEHASKLAMLLTEKVNDIADEHDLSDDEFYRLLDLMSESMMLFATLGNFNRNKSEKYLQTRNKEVQEAMRYFIDENSSFSKQMKSKILNAQP